MNLKLEIRRNADGAMATDIWRDWNFNVFWWEEGNAACDCNRGDFFNQALGDMDSDEPCGDDRYSVRLSDADTGEVLYDELSACAVSEGGAV